MTLIEIIRNVLNNKPLNQEQLDRTARWMMSENARNEFMKALDDRSESDSSQTDLDYPYILSRVNRRIGNSKRSFNYWKWSGIAASVVLILATGYYLSLGRFTTPDAEIVPGVAKATLILANGSSLELGHEQPDTLLEDGSVLNIERDKICYDAGNSNGTIRTNTLDVPRGGEYTVKLSDGTTVWLNSESRLRFPTRFATSQRKVYLEGEAYFQVAHDASRPFVVETSEQLITVLGTEFNLTAYLNEPTITTLLSGSVKLENSDMTTQQELHPGEQAVLHDSGSFTVLKVNAEESQAWRSGLFVFDNLTLEQVMHKLERWYDVTVEFTDVKCKSIEFKGNLPKSSNLKSLLLMIEKISEAKFVVNDRHVKVSLK